MNRLEEFRHRDRFGNIIFASAFSNFLLVAFHGKGCDGDNRDRAKFIVFLKPARDIETRDFRQLNVHQDQVWFLFTRKTQDVEAVFRLDAGFGTSENVALLIEMGYEVYTKPYCNWLSGLLSEMSAKRVGWQRVGDNAEMIARKAVSLDGFPYPLDIGYQRFWTGNRFRFTALLHFGDQQVTDDLPTWFQDYNARQLIEAGNKEAKQVFKIRHLKVRSRPALRLQEHFALFAANFVRFASKWLSEQCDQVPNAWKNTAQPHVKEQVKVGAHSPATIEWLGQDCLVRFDDRSVYAGRSFTIRRQVAIQLALPWKFAVFSPT